MLDLNFKWLVGAGDEGGQPPLLFLHGFLGSADDWSSIARGLSCPSLAIDLPGHGGSMGAKGHWFEETSGALDRLMDVERIERARVVGYSLGGRVAMHFALSFPNRIEKLVVESSNPGNETSAERAARSASDDIWAEKIRHDWPGMLSEWYNQPVFSSLLDSPLLHVIKKERARGEPGRLAEALRGYSTGRHPSMWNQLSALEPDMLFIAGTRDRKYQDIGSRLQENSPRINFALIEGAGHIVHTEQPRAYLAALVEFFELEQG